MTKSIQQVLQPDGTYRWDYVEHESEASRSKACAQCLNRQKRPKSSKVVKPTDTENNVFVMEEQVIQETPVASF